MTKKKSKQKGKVEKLTKAVAQFKISEPGTSQSSASTSAVPGPSTSAVPGPSTASAAQASTSKATPATTATAPAQKSARGRAQATASKAPTPAAAVPGPSTSATTAVSPTTSQPGDTILDTNLKPQLLAKWPKVKNKVPPIFLHKPTDFEQHVKKVLTMGIKFYQPNLGKNYTKIICESFNDHKHLTKYFEKKQLPFHTFGHPTKRKMKVVIRGLPKEVELSRVKNALKSVSIPVIRVHIMNTKQDRKDNTILVLAVVPFDETGKIILKLSKLLGHKVTLEPPFSKPKQCHRCQKWGHSQRHCHGEIKCVKCAGEHLSKKCERDPEKEPPKCANCSEDHTASYRECLYTPGSTGYIMLQEIKIHKPCYKPPQLVTLENYETLYKNVDYGKTPAKK